LGVPEERARTIYKGHDVEWYDGIAAKTRADLGLSEKACLIGFLGNMRRLKGVDLILEAFSDLPGDGSVQILLIGEVRDPLIKDLYENHPFKQHIKILGFQENASTLLKLCDIFVMPSRKREGLCKAVAEAMSQSVPPIVSRIGGMPELVQDGESGLVVDPNSSTALAQGLRRLIDNPEERRRFGRNARERINEYFNIDQTISQTADLYKSIVN
jgi:glycosyltransferase involved in cell wall biosynthesis